MDKMFYRLYFLIIAFVALAIYAFPWYAIDKEVPFTGEEYKLGLDLQGGVELDYTVDLSIVKKDPDFNAQKENSILEGLKSIIDRRIEALNISDSIITTANYGQEKHIIVQIPMKGTDSEENKANIARAKEAIGKVMKIEFRELRKEIKDEDLKERKDLAYDFFDSLNDSNYTFMVNANRLGDNNQKVDVGTMTGTLLDLEKYFVLEDDVETGIYKEVLTGSGISKFNYELGNIISSVEDGYWVLNIIDFKDEVLNFEYVFVSAEPSEWIAAKDSSGRVLDDRYFVNSSVQFNEAFQPMVELTFNDEGAKIFGELTTRLVGQQIAIFVGGEMLTSPVVNQPILNGRAVITGNFTPVEARKLSQDINTGVVPAPIYLTSERVIDSRLGINSLSQLINAGIIGFLIIFVFLIFVYRLSGLAASLALFIYVVLVLFIVKTFGVVLTLASIAGLILSIGIAIDANILIFERIKDELKTGHKLDKSIKDGFKKSWTAIWDANLTGLIIALILFIFGINMIKGFGLMLAIGIVVSLFSAMFISRLFIILISKKKGLGMKGFIGFRE